MIGCPAAWAETMPSIRRAYLSGSRLAGAHRPDSDLDVAIEFDAPEGERDCSCGSKASVRARGSAVSNLTCDDGGPSVGQRTCPFETNFVGVLPMKDLTTFL